MADAENSTRENAPLVELIAEVRWEPAIPPGEQLSAGGLGPTLITPRTTALDEFFMRFGAQVHGANYTIAERLVPSGVPILLGQPVYRFREATGGETQSLYQVGAGVFTANAVPPYESWSKFEPVVRVGIEALLKSRAPEEFTRPLLAASLRYIDAFGPSHTEGRDVGQFLNDVLGISISVPHALTRHLQVGAAPKPVIQLQIPMNSGMLMSVGIGEGMLKEQEAILMDTSVATTLPLPPTLEAAMEVLNLAHDAIDASFSDLVKRIDHLMPRKAKSSK